MLAQRDEELTGIWGGKRVAKEDGWCVGWLRESQHCCVGLDPREDLVAGLTYRFIGYWHDNPDFGEQFKFKAFVQDEPHTRTGVVKYLDKYATGIGPAIANAIVDKFGPKQAIGTLKLEPERAAEEIRGLRLEVAQQAARALILVQKFQETTIQMLDLIGGHGFGEKAITECINIWGVHAPNVIKRDPFKLMTKQIPGAGFGRCDKLWHVFGLRPDKMKRQVMAAWSHLRNDMSGSTWHLKKDVVNTILLNITGNARPERALRIATIAGVLTQEYRDGSWWVADKRKAEDEMGIVESIARLLEPITPS